jgi:hypothetical protein
MTVFSEPFEKASQKSEQCLKLQYVVTTIRHHWAFIIYCKTVLLIMYTVYTYCAVNESNSLTQGF